MSTKLLRLLKKSKTEIAKIHYTKILHSELFCSKLLMHKLFYLFISTFNSFYKYLTITPGQHVNTLSEATKTWKDILDTTLKHKDTCGSHKK